MHPFSVEGRGSLDGGQQGGDASPHQASKGGVGNKRQSATVLKRTRHVMRAWRVRFRTCKALWCPATKPRPPSGFCSVREALFIVFGANMKRVWRSFFALVVCASALASLRASTPAHATAGGPTEAYFPIRNNVGFGVSVEWDWNNDPITPSITVVFDAPVEAPPANYRVTSGDWNVDTTRNYDAGGNLYYNVWADYQVADNNGQLFNCYPRIFIYSNGQYYYYWGQGPDTRCTDFSSNNNASGSTCGPSPYQTTESYQNIYVTAGDGSLIGIWSGTQRFNYNWRQTGSGDLLCSQSQWTKATFSCGSQYYCEDQFSGKMCGGCTKQTYAGSPAIVPPFVYENNCVPNGYSGTSYSQWCQTGYQKVYMYVKKAGGSVFPIYAIFNWTMDFPNPWGGPELSATFTKTTSGVCCAPTAKPPGPSSTPAPAPTPSPTTVPWGHSHG